MKEHNGREYLSRDLSYCTLCDDLLLLYFLKYLRAKLGSLENEEEAVHILPNVQQLHHIRMFQALQLLKLLPEVLYVPLRMRCEYEFLDPPQQPQLGGFSPLLPDTDLKHF
jgi:hypothetical protein